MANETFTAIQTTVATPGFDADADGVIDPGERVTTTVTITNNSTTPTPVAATGVQFTEDLQGMRLVNQAGDDINASPIAFDDSYSAAGNVAFGATISLLINDTEPLGPEGLALNAGTAIQNTGVAFATTQGGSVTLNANGTFSYISAVGFEGVDTFTYTLRDTGLDGVAGNADDLSGPGSIGTVSITVGPSVWFIDNTAPGSTNVGTQANPFTSIAAFNAAQGQLNGPDADDVIYLRAGTYTEADGINLGTGQTLIGQGDNLVVNGATIEVGSAGLTPTIIVTGAGNQAVQLAQNNTLSGFDVGMNNATATGIADGGGTVGTLKISNVGVGVSQNLGSAVDIDQGGTLNVLLEQVTSTGAARGIDLGSTTGLSGTGNGFTVSGATTINDATGDGIAIGNSSLNATFNSLVTIVNDVGAATIADGVDLGTGAGGANTGTYSFNGGVNVTVNGTNAFGFRAQSSGTVNIADPGGTTTQITSVNGTALLINPTTLNATLDSITSGGGTDGISLTGMSGALTIGSVSINGQTGDGVAITNSAGSLIINGGSIGNTNDPGSSAVDISGGAGNVSIAASLTDTTGSGAIAEITGRTGGTVTLSGNLSATGAVSNGIDVNGNTGGTINFTGQTQTLTTGANTAVNLASNTGATINFNPTGGGNGLDITTTSGVGFNATGGGTVTVQGSGNTINSGTGTALNIANTTIGANDLTFQTISSNGGSATGIILDTTGSAGGLHVTGTGTAASGGTIANKTGADGSTTTGVGIYLNNTADLQLANMQLNDFQNYAIRGVSVNGFTLTNSVLNGVSGNSTSADANGADAGGEGAIRFFNALGTSTISGTTIEGGFEDNIHIFNNTGTGVFTITSSTVKNNSTTDGNDGVFAMADTGATLTLKVLNSTLQHNRGDHINTTQSGSGVMHTVIVGTTMTYNGTIGEPGSLTETAGGGITLTTGANFTGNSTFNISDNNITGSKTAPININNTSLTSTLTGVFSGTINNNTIGTVGDTAFDNSGSFDGDGMDITANGDATIHVAITNNDIMDWKLLGLNMVARDGAAKILATVTGNTIGTPFSLTESLQAIVFNGGPAGTETGHSVVDIGGAGALANTIVGPFTAGILPIRVRQRADNEVSLPGYGGSPTDTAAVAAYLSGRNGGAGATATVNSPPGDGFTNSAPNPTPNTPSPLLAAPGDVEAAQWHVAGIGDFNGDGLADALVLRDDGLLGVGTINGDPATDSQVLGQLGAQWHIAGVGDVNNDGTSDILLKNDNGTYQADLIRNNAVAATVDLVLVDGELRAAPAPGPDAPPSDPAPVDPMPVKPPPAEPPVQPASGTVETHLTQAELDGIVSAAIARWSATGLTAEQVAALEHMTFAVGDLSGLNLGSFTPAQITLDADAGGRGWYLDATPGDDAEFGAAFAATRMQTDPSGAPAGHYDLLTAIMHEMGHTLGLGDSYLAADRDDLMYGWLFTGERRLPGDGDADGAVAGAIVSEEFLGAPIDIGVLPAGKQVIIHWQATIDPQTNQLIVNPVNTGTVSATNAVGFPDQNTNTVTTTLDTLVLGGTIWNDNGAGGGTAANGSLDGTEPGVNGVQLSLFVDANDDNVPDSPASPIATTTTAGGGTYSFTGLAPGNYIVRVDAGNFTGVGALAGLQVSPVTAPEPPDPDTGDPDVDNDDNGSRTIGQAAFSLAITLAYNTEPTAGTGNDTNNTLDFGFFNNPSPDLVNLAGAVTFTEGDAPILLDTGAAATVTDDQANLSGGNLTAAITGNKAAAEDVLGFSVAPATTVTLTSGTSVGSTVSVGGVAIGTIAAGGTGTGTDNLIVTFNSNATPAAVSTLIEALTYFDTSVDNPSPLPRTIAVTVDDGLTGTDTENVLVNVIAIDDPTVLQNDAVTTTENVVLNGSVFADNGFGPDSDPDTPLVVSQVNGNAGNVNNPILLASGALLTVGANGNFTYDPNGALDYLPAPGSGASNLSVIDTFTYTVTPTASVTVTVTGVDSDDILMGTAGIDNLSGGIGNDRYVVGNSGDGVNEAFGAGYDIVVATVDYILPVNVEALYIVGAGLVGTGSGAGDALLSTGGANTLVGLGGADLFYVNNGADVVIEAANGGVDTVIATSNYVMPSEVEALYLVGTGLTGTGSGGADNLLSSGGANIMVGLAGDDLYYVNNSGDTVTESGGAGYDIVVAGADYVLPANVEALYMTGAGLTGTGSGGADTLLSTGGANILAGLGGDDLYYVNNSGDTVTESGGAGYDIVVAGASFALPVNVEALYMQGAGAEAAASTR
jgi:hypothetical protein